MGQPILKGYARVASVEGFTRLAGSSRRRCCARRGRPSADAAAATPRPPCGHGPRNRRTKTTTAVRTGPLLASRRGKRARSRRSSRPRRRCPASRREIGTDRRVLARVTDEQAGERQRPRPFVGDARYVRVADGLREFRGRARGFRGEALGHRVGRPAEVVLATAPQQEGIAHTHRLRGGQGQRREPGERRHERDRVGDDGQWHAAYQQSPA